MARPTLPRPEPDHPIRDAILGVALVIGGVFALREAIRLRTEPLEHLARIGVETMSVDSQLSSSVGAFYVIEVGGVRYTCRGAEDKLPAREPIPVLYDPARPSDCRARSLVGRMGGYVRTAFAVSFLLAASGLVFLFKAYATRTPPPRA